MKRWVGLLMLIVGAAVAGSGLSCRQIVGIEDNRSEAGTSACGLPYGTSVCAACASASCCSESQACAGDTACSQYESCLGPCDGGAACRSQCRIDHTVPTVSLGPTSRLSACLASKCESECNLPCGDLASLLSTPDAAASCESCLSRSCSSAQTCASSAACDEFHRCLPACQTNDCTQACQLAQSGPGVPALVEGGAGNLFQSTPWISNCATACASGHDWSCVGHVSTPSAKSPTATVDFRALAYPANSPIANLDVRACALGDSNCDMVRGRATTDPAGLASVSYQNVSQNGTTLNLGLSAYLRIEPPDAGSSIVPYLYFWGFPLSESTWHSYWPLISPETFQSNVSGIPVTPAVTIDPSKGHVQAAVWDCAPNVAPDVTVTLTDETGTVEVDSNGTPNAPTNSAGWVFFVNVRPGTSVVTATPKDTGAPASKVDIVVRAGFITAVLMMPTPL